MFGSPFKWIKLIFESNVLLLIALFVESLSADADESASKMLIFICRVYKNARKIHFN